MIKRGYTEPGTSLVTLADGAETAVRIVALPFSAVSLIDTGFQAGADAAESRQKPFQRLSHSASAIGEARWNGAKPLKRLTCVSRSENHRPEGVLIRVKILVAWRIA